MNAEAFDPSSRYALLAADGTATLVEGGRAFWSQSSEALDRAGADWLVSELTCDADWPSWERHPDAEEFVYLLSGEASMHLETAEGLRVVPLRGRGAVVVPRGTWHTAKVAAPSRMLFVTRGRGTEHRAVEA